MPKFTFFCFVFIYLLPIDIICQTKSALPKKGFDSEDAQEHFSHGNYTMALPIYKELLKKEPQNVQYNYNTGICYLNTNINKSLSISYLEFVSKQTKIDIETWYELGRAYHYAERYDDAIIALNKYKKIAKVKDQAKADRLIEHCNNAKELVKFPIDIAFENLGKEINSAYADYYPLISKDEGTLVFTTRRKETTGGQIEFDGYYPSDIFIATSSKKGEWSKAKSIGNLINTSFDEQAVGMSSDGKNIVVYIDHIDSAGNLYLSENKKTGYQKLNKLNSNVNNGFERSGSISPDGEVIFFASDRENGFGETDLYMSRKLPNGQWALAQNLGPKINTAYKEDFPFLTEDGKTLYFSSQGHSSMGDFDLFKAIWNPETNTWSGPINLGYPLNTPAEDRCISFSANNRVAYVSSLRNGGMGDLDIYKVVFNDAQQRYTIVTGNITSNDSLHKPLKAIVTATNIKTKKEYTYSSTPSSGKYIMALAPGKYAITINSLGFKEFIETIDILDLGAFQPETKRDFILEKIF